MALPLIPIAALAGASAPLAVGGTVVPAALLGGAAAAGGAAAKGAWLTGLLGTAAKTVAGGVATQGLMNLLLPQPTQPGQPAQPLTAPQFHLEQLLAPIQQNSKRHTNQFLGNK